MHSAGILGFVIGLILLIVGIWLIYARYNGTNAQTVHANQNLGVVLATIGGLIVLYALLEWVSACMPSCAPACPAPCPRPAC